MSASEIKEKGLLLREHFGDIGFSILVRRIVRQGKTIEQAVEQLFEFKTPICEECYWWAPMGNMGARCQNTNWCGKPSKPADPICAGCSFTSRDGVDRT
jgi:hypothetical protein